MVELEKIKSRKISKDILYKMITTNSRPGLGCRLAFDEKNLSLLVIGDQIIETLDQLEIENLILNVISLSKEFNELLKN